MGTRDQIRAITEMAQGFDPDAEISISNGHHLKVTLHGPKGRRSIFASATPSDHRAIKNFRSDLRRLANDLGISLRT